MFFSNSCAKSLVLCALVGSLAHALGGRADYITRYDFDADLDGRNDWDRAGNAAYPRPAALS
jgi:hypothetical protein